jgi:hypothetical protein
MFYLLTRYKLLYLEQLLHYSADSQILYYKTYHSTMNEGTHYFHTAGFEILTAVLLMSQVFWDAMSTIKVTNILEDNCLQLVGQAV